MDGDVECMANLTDATAGGVIFFGTNKGKVYKYIPEAATLAEVFSCDKAVLSLNMYGDVLFIGLAGGEFAKLTTGYLRA